MNGILAIGLIAGAFALGFYLGSQYAQSQIQAEVAKLSKLAMEGGSPLAGMMGGARATEKP